MLRSGCTMISSAQCALCKIATERIVETRLECDLGWMLAWSEKSRCCCRMVVVATISKIA